MDGRGSIQLGDIIAIANPSRWQWNYTNASVEDLVRIVERMPNRKYFRDTTLFGFVGNNYNWFTMSMFFPVMMTVTLASLPWLSLVPWNGIPWRFSLRTLLIVTTLVAVILGLGVWLARL